MSLLFGHFYTGKHAKKASFPLAQLESTFESAEIDLLINFPSVNMSLI